LCGAVFFVCFDRAAKTGQSMKPGGRTGSLQLSPGVKAPQPARLDLFLFTLHDNPHGLDGRNR
jgi:hypothetical protein